jgi:nucleoside-diphosphate-sugar epimerase
MNLVTGATGLLGSHIAEKLVQSGQPVRCLVRPSSDTRRLDQWGVEKAPGDITDPASLAAAFRGVERVYHAAAQVGDWGPWERFVAVSIEGTRNMLEAAKAAGVKRFCHVSSISAYGHPDGKGLVLDETAPLGVDLYKWSYYSRAKVIAERLAWEYHAAGHVPVTCIKPSWLYGQRDRASMPRLIRAIRAGKGKLVGSGENLLNLAHAANVAEGCILAATSDRALGESYNLSSDGDITQTQYLNKIAECIGAKPVTRSVPYGVARSAAFLMELVGHALRTSKPPLVTRYAVWLMGRQCFFSSQKARDQLGWRPSISYEVGVPAAVKWCLEDSEA